MYVFALIALTLLLIIVIYFFTTKQLTRKEMWTERFSSLNAIDPDKYKFYFDNVKVRDFSDNFFQRDKIFVSIASYRDDQCRDTVKNLAEMADRPELLHIVICQQNTDSDSDCIAWCVSENEHPSCKVTITDIERLDHTEARGPTWARFRIQQKWTGEEYFLQIDAHTRVTKHWDTILKEQLEKCPSKKPCLTQYPPSYDIVSKKDRNDSGKENWRINKLRGGVYIEKFNDPDGFTRIQSDWIDEIPEKPIPGVGWAGGFSFSKGDFIKENSYDPYTPFLFFGEEMDIIVRAFTNNWDFFSPTVSCLFTNYNRDHRKTFWEHPDQKECEILSRFRIYVRLGYIKENDIPEKYRFILKDIHNFPIGEFRSIKDYEEKAKIDIKNESLK
jgi:hypothetical protein